jgi:hypothetical protein
MKVYGSMLSALTSETVASEANKWNSWVEFTAKLEWSGHGSVPPKMRN